MTAKFKLDIEEEFGFIKKSKQEQTEKKSDKITKFQPHIENGDVNKTNIQNMNIYNMNKQKKRVPASVIALRSRLLEILGDNQETIIKMKDISQDIGYSLSWMQFAMKNLIETGEFTFIRYAEGKTRGMKVRRQINEK